MMVTARQLAALHKAAGGTGQVVLPYRARLTPMAADWIRSSKVTIGYSDLTATKAEAGEKKPVAAAAVSSGIVSAGEYLWWCDGSCGQVKAAIAMESKQTPMRELVSAGGGGLLAAIKTIAAQVKAGKSSGGVLVVETGGVAVVLANRCASLRAIVGTSLAAVEQGVNGIAANVLIIEHPRLNLSQARNLLSRFLRGKRELNESARQQMSEVASCG
jgi:ribose 5-phosphate isomerase RpiB